MKSPSESRAERHTSDGRLRMLVLAALICGLIGAVEAGNISSRPQGAEEVRARTTADVMVAFLFNQLRASVNEPLRTASTARLLDACRAVARQLTLDASRDASISIRCTALAAPRTDDRPDELERDWLVEAQRAADSGMATAPIYRIFDGQPCQLRHLRWLVPPDGGNGRVAVSVRIGIREPCDPR